MKNRFLFITVLLNLLFQPILFSQNTDSRKEFERLKMLQKYGDFALAAECAEGIFESGPEDLQQYIHNTLVLDLKKSDTKNSATSLLNELYKRKNTDLKRVIVPLYYYNLFLSTTKTDSLDLLLKEYIAKMDKTDNFQAKTELYSLLILKRLLKVEYPLNELTHTLLTRSVENLKKFREIDSKKVSDREILLKRTWYRYILSNLYYFEYKNSSPTNETAIRNAFVYSTDELDMKYGYKFLIDNSLLWTSTRHLGFESEYADFLLQKGDKKQALEVLTQKAILMPSRQNIQKLKDLFQELISDIAFPTYWLNNIEKYYKPVISFSFNTLDNQKIKLADLKGSWVYLDVWGTWCGPCRSDLPNVQAFYDEIKKNEKSQLNMFTLSSNSSDLEDFMKNNKYTFPVAEIGRNETSILNVQYFPSRFLITPQGNLITVPFGFNWRELVTNFYQTAIPEIN